MNRLLLQLATSVAAVSIASAATTTPSPTPSGTHKYSPSEQVEQFHALPRPPGFENDFSTEWDYLGGVLLIAAIPIVCFFLFIGFYFNFLCIRSGCCSCCCNFFKCWRGVMKCCCTRYLVDSCCPLAEKGGDNVEEPHGCGTCCLCRKNKTACCHNGWPGTRENGKAIKARGIAIFLFVGLILLQIGPFWGLNALSDAVDTVAESIADLADAFDDLDTQFTQLMKDGDDIKRNASKLSSSCHYPDAQTVANDIKTYGSTISTLGWTMSETLGSTVTKLDKWSDKASNKGGEYLAYWDAGSTYKVTYGAFFFMGILYSVSGLLGSICCETKRKCCQFASCCLAFSSWVGILILFILTVTIVVELLIGVILSDFCYAGPASSMMDFVKDMNSTSNAGMVRTLGYYTKCTGTNPFRGDLNTASTKVSEASTELSDGASEISNDPGCDMGRYNTITNILSSMSSDNGVLDKISDVIGCWEIEPIFEKLLQSAMCDHTVNGFYFLFGSHAAMMIYIYVAMYFSSFLRQGLQGHNICSGYKYCAHEDKHTDHYFDDDDEDDLKGGSASPNAIELSEG